MDFNINLSWGQHPISRAQHRGRIRMKNNDSWNKFTKSGNIYDYLSYIACTVEDFTGLLIKESKEGEYLSDNNTGTRDGSIGHANW